MLSTDGGSVGLNLQVADVVINVDLPWNPARLEQRIARAWRKHQRRSVQVVHLVAEGSIEQRMLATLATKRAVAAGAIDGSPDAREVDLPSGRAAFLERLEALVAAERQAEPAARAAPAAEPPPPDAPLAPPLAPRVLALTKDPILAAWAKQPDRTSWWHLLTFGTPAILAAAAIAPGRRKTLDPLLLVWIITGFILIFLPLARQRRFLPGLYAPIAILAVIGFRRLQARGFRKTATLLMASAFPVSALILLLGMASLLPGPRYLSK